MMIFSLVAMPGFEKCCITSAYLQWLCHSGERPVASGPLVYSVIVGLKIGKNWCCGVKNGVVGLKKIKERLKGLPGNVPLVTDIGLQLGKTCYPCSG